MSIERLSAESVERITKASRRSRDEAHAVYDRPLHVLPAAWFEPHVAAAMSDWITKTEAPT